MKHRAKIELHAGDAIPPLALPPLDRLTLALYCGASGDHNPIHVDIDYARNTAGLDDVIGHGMLTMAYLGRLLTNWVPQPAIRHFDTRMLTPARIGDRITCTGSIIGITNADGRMVKVGLRADTHNDVCLATGTALIAAE
jgi:acyl dehydratase